MAKFIGRRAALGIGKETVRGTPVAPSFWIPVTAFDFDDKVEKVKNNSGFGVIDENSGMAITQQRADGSFEGKIFDKSEGLILSALFGQAPTSVQRASTGVYDHTFSMLNSNQHLSLTTAVKDANYDVRYALSMIDSWELGLSLDDWVKRTVNLISKKSATASNTTAYVDENEFTPKDVSLALAATGANLAATQTNLDGAAVTKVTSLGLSINKNVEGLQVYGSNDFDDVVNKNLAISGTIEAFYDDTTLRDLAFNDTQRAMRIAIKNTALDLGSGHNPELRFEFPAVKFENYSRSSDLDDVSKASVDFTALFEFGAALTASARLTNRQASY